MFLAFWWRILGRPLEYLADKAVCIVKACCVLHNLLAYIDGVNTPVSRYIPANFSDSDTTGSPQLEEWLAGDTNFLEPLGPRQLSRARLPDGLLSVNTWNGTMAEQHSLLRSTWSNCIDQ